MKKILSALSLVLSGVFLFVAPFIGSMLVPDAKPKSQSLQDCTALIKAEDGYGSGVVVSHKGDDGHYVTYVWTVAHVIWVNETTKTVVGPFTFLVPTGTGHVATNIIVTIQGIDYPASVVDYSRDGNDVALLRIWQADATKSSVRFYEPDLPLAQGTSIFYFGNFLGPRYVNAMTTGTFARSSTMDESGLTEDMLSLQVMPGCSGGGVFTQDGQCIGLTTSMLQGTALSFINPIRNVREWAREEGLTYALSGE